MPGNSKNTGVKANEPVEKVQENGMAMQEPFFADGAHSIYLYKGDALALLRDSKSDQFDLIFADPLYGRDAKKRGETYFITRRRNKKIAASRYNHCGTSYHIR